MRGAMRRMDKQRFSFALSATSRALRISTIRLWTKRSTVGMAFPFHADVQVDHLLLSCLVTRFPRVCELFNLRFLSLRPLEPECEVHTLQRQLHKEAPQQSLVLPLQGQGPTCTAPRAQRMEMSQLPWMRLPGFSLPPLPRLPRLHFSRCCSRDQHVQKESSVDWRTYFTADAVVGEEGSTMNQIPPSFSSHQF